MGRVFAWKLRYVNSSNPSEWKIGYTWLSPDGGGWSPDTPPTDTVLDEAMEFATLLNDPESYRIAFTTMLSNIPKEFLCTTRLRSPEEYYYDPCEWGGQNGYCGVQQSRGKITIKRVEPDSIHCNDTSAQCDNSIVVIQSDTYQEMGPTGGTFAFVIETSKVNDLKVYWNNVDYTSSVRKCCQMSPLGTNKWRYIAICNVSTGNYNEQIIRAESANAATASKTFRLLKYVPEEATFSFSPRTRNVAATATTAYSTFTINNATVTSSALTGDNATVSVSGNRYIISFPNNCDTSTSGSSKSFVLTLMGVSGSTSGACSATFSVTQAACEETCVPSVSFTTPKPVNVVNTDTSTSILYTADCYDDITVSCSGDPAFSVAKDGVDKVKVMFSENTSSNQRNTTVTVKASKSGKPDATDTIKVIQAGVSEKSITLTGPATVPLNGGTLVFTATTKYVEFTSATVNPSNVGTLGTINKGTTSTTSATGAGTVTLTVNAVPSTPTTEGNGEHSISVKKTGYRDKTVKMDCENTNVCLEPLTRTFTIQAFGKDSDNNQVSSNTLTITQKD